MYLKRGKLLSFPVFDNVCLPIGGVVEVFFCVAFRSLGVFVVFKRDCLDDIRGFRCRLKLYSGDSTEAVCERTGQCLHGKVCVELPLYMRK